MQRTLFVALTILLAACDTNIEKAMNLFTGQETNVVVLLDKPTQLGPISSTLASNKEPMKVLGEWSSLCLSLRGAVPLQDYKVMDRVFSEAMGNANVTIDLTLSNGTQVSLRKPLQAWSLYGKIVEKNELSACASAPCKVKLPIGVHVSRVGIASDIPLTVQGIYWQSETDPPKPPPANKQVAGAASPTASSACSG